MFALNELPNPAALENFFFEAMCRTGWPSSTPRITPSTLLKGWKETTYSTPYGTLYGEHYTLHFSDSWGSDRGVTKITFRNEAGLELLLWFMQYKHGIVFAEDSLPFLMKHLRKTYSEHIFCGGRGKSRTTSDGDELLYHNHYTGTFVNFSGRERVYSRDESDSFTHLEVGNTRYRGGCLY